MSRPFTSYIREWTSRIIALWLRIAFYGLELERRIGGSGTHKQDPRESQNLNLKSIEIR